MVKETKRESWINAFADEGLAGHFDPRHVGFLDDKLHALWRLGRNVITSWAADSIGLTVLVVPHHIIADYSDVGGEEEESSDNFIEKLFFNHKKVDIERLNEIGVKLGYKPERIDLPFIPGEDLGFDVIDSIVKRYSVTLVKDKAVALFDAVGFSLFSPLEQVAQLNSLAYSVNSAFSKLLDKEIRVRFARTTTGDGFYIWNRHSGIDAAIDLYHFMHLILADNAIARSKAQGNSVPLLRTCFHFGPHYEFYQTEGLSPTTFSYIVGEVTIDLARMIDKASPGQVLIGDFTTPMKNEETGKIETYNAIQFIDKAQDTLSNLKGVVLAGDEIDSLKCYLTGTKSTDGDFKVKKYRFADKHGFNHDAFNAKVNIYRSDAEPIFLGIQDSDIKNFDVVE